ncbi:MAG: hypothetical protein HN842_01895, partial [Gammaproteobacteria bacterium]|nr:hypothetical protein [Gammaproteobacteria bacterium]
LDLPPVEPLEDPSAEIREREMFALLGYADGEPVCLGFLHPRSSQLMFDDKKRAFWRHHSDVYSTVDEKGNIEVRHPSGTYVRIGTEADHEDLEGKGFNENFEIKENKTEEVSIRVELQKNGVQKAVITIDPDGNAAFESQGRVDVNAKDDIGLNSDKSIRIKAGEDLWFDAQNIHTFEDE